MTFNYLKQTSLLLFTLTTIAICTAQKLERRAMWQAKINSPSRSVPGAKIVSIQKGSPLEKAGLLPNDIILKVDNKLVKDGETWTEIYYGIRESKIIEVEVLRDINLMGFVLELNALPKEVHKSVDTFYEELTSVSGITQRVIITKPRKVVKQPAIILIGGLSCSSIEIYPGRTGNWVKVIKDLVEKTDMVVMRIEKPGVGDSGGDCSQSDFITDLEGYRAAVKLLKSKPYVDDEKIVVYGSSMGSAIAPLLANEFNLAGIISDGTFFKTWFEHMLEIERRIRSMSGDSESEIVEKMNNYYIPLYYGMLIQKKTFKEVIDEYPAIKKYNYHSSRHMYGRPLEYYQQLQDFDLAGEWEKAQVPVRIMRGTNDWIMSSFDNNMIIDVLKKSGHQDHILYEYEGLDHWNTLHDSPKKSFEGKPGRWEDNISQIIVEWAREIVNLK